MIITLPLLVFYMLAKPAGLILTAEVILRDITTLFGILPRGFTEIFWIIAVFFLCKKEGASFRITPNATANTLIESFLYATLLIAYSVFILDASFFRVEGMEGYALSSLPSFIAMKSGAGFIEEFFFRFILLGGMVYSLRKFAYANIWTIGTALVLTSFLFSEIHSFHFFPGLADLFGVLPNEGETYTTEAFFFRFLSGIALGTIYLKRGFGTAVWTHAFFGYLSLVALF